jgi:catechol 2,3-dioxygenase-like lactoylglutathione lyase family enzyme
VVNQGIGEGANPRIRRVVETALDCDDLPKSAAFYTTLFATEPMISSDRLVAIDAGEGTVLLLFQRGLSAEPVQLPGGLVPPHDAGGPGHLALAIEAADIPAWEARLAALGIAVESRVTWERGGFSIYFRDPDNRSVELATPGIWPNY